MLIITDFIEAFLHGLLSELKKSY